MLIERFVFFDRNEIRKMLAFLEEAGIERNEDRTGKRVVWIVKKEDLQRANAILKEHHLRAVHKPWD
jgi:hypothetical protein